MKSKILRKIKKINLIILLYQNFTLNFSIGIIHLL